MCLTVSYALLAGGTSLAVGEAATVLTVTLRGETVQVAITYTNRKRQTYYLHQGKTKTGKPKQGYFILDS